MRYFVYKTFTWTIVILTALFGTFLTGVLTGALGMQWAHEENKKNGKPTSYDPPID